MYLTNWTGIIKVLPSERGIVELYQLLLTTVVTVVQIFYLLPKLYLPDKKQNR